MIRRPNWILLIGCASILCGLVGCGSDEAAKPGNTSDTTAPQVVGNDPRNGEVAVSLDDSVFVIFNEAMDPATAAGNVTLSSGTISGSTWYTDRMLAVGHGDWSEGTQVTATVGTGLTDAAGNALAAAYNFSFWTMSSNLMFLASNPADSATDVNRDGGIVLTFSGRVNMSSLMSHVTIQDTTPVKTEYPYTASEIEEGVVLLTPASTLPADTMIWIVIEAGLADFDGGSTLAATETVSFTTGADTDTTPPTVLATEPANGSTNVPGDYGYFRMTFSEPMDPTSIEPTSWNLAFALAIQVADPTPEWTANNTVMTVPLPDNLAAGTPIEIVFEGMADLAGNMQTTPFVYSAKIAGNADYSPFVDGVRFADYVVWSEGDVGSSVPTDSGAYWEYYQWEAQPNSVFREAEYTDGTFTTVTGYYEEYRKVSNAVQWVGFENSTKVLAKAEPFTTPLTILPLPVALGTWTGSTSVTIPGEGTFTADLNGEVEAMEDIDVPGFGDTVFVKDAWRVSWVLDISLDGSPAFVEEHTTWYAPNYGPIHRLFTETDDANWFSEDVWRYPPDVLKAKGDSSSPRIRPRLW